MFARHPRRSPSSSLKSVINALGISRFPHRLVRAVSVCVCLALIASSLFVVPLQSANAGTRHGSRPTPGLLSGLGGVLAALLLPPDNPPSVPGGDLPDLDTMRAVSPSNPAAPAPSPSNQSCPDCTPCPTCGSNHAPTAIAGLTYHGFANQSVQFNGDSSFDADGEGLTWAWNFGDSSTGSGPTPTHTYSSAGTYTVTLTVTDSHSASDGDTTSAVIVTAPSPTPTPTPSGSGNNAAFVSQSVPTTVNEGSTYPVSVTMRNTGTTTWSAAHLYRLGSQNSQDNATWGMARVYLPTDVPPGTDVTFDFTLVAPAGSSHCSSKWSSGTHYHFQWKLVQDAVEWFGNATTDVEVRSCSGTPPSSYTPDDHYSARLEARNRTGGDDLLSRNFHWSAGVLGLLGRSGLDLGLSLSYNSLVWTRVDSAFIFDADRGFPGPGFHLGFPTIQGPFTNDQAGAQSYLLITPSGDHVELRQVSTNVYESVDSSYFQLIDDGTNGLLLKDTGGGQMTYLLINGEYHCTSIKDRNGNYISVNYGSINSTATVGRITSIVDTLGRTITFNYDSNYRLQTITQAWNGQTHVWASFGYSDLTVQTNFTVSGGQATIQGIPGNNTLSVLTQVGFADGSHYNFDYTSWGQVWRIKHYAADNHQLSYMSYNLPQNNSTEQVDCPRFTERRDWAENWNDEDEAVTTYSYNSEAIVDGQMVWDEVDWSQATMPDGTKYRECATAGYDDWKRGLVTKTEVYSSDNSTTPKKTTTTAWTQDLTGVGYQLNPRATSNLITDSDGNRNLTTMEYTSFGLPFDVFQWRPYGDTGWVLLKRAHTDYELSQPYLDRRIIGLPQRQFLFGNEDNQQRLFSKVSYEYDASGEFLASAGTVVQHDGTNYGSGFAVGRGNVTSVRRWDVNHETDNSYTTLSRVGYNTTGSPIFSRDPLDHQTSMSYADSFSVDGATVSNPSFPDGATASAYPTTVTDADSNSSTIRYNYDFGAKTRVQGPNLNGSAGESQVFAYDSAGRPSQATTTNNGAYTRFVYPTTQTIVNQFTTINDVNSEAYSATILDGAGRTRGTATDLPNSTGHYSGSYASFDVMGRAVLQTNPTEMNHNWTASGDDSTGWYSTTQTYDWKGRPLVTTNQDGTTKQASYGGCGCAGGAIVTLTDEGTVVSSATKKRQQKIYADAIGRTVKTEILNWDGSGSYGTGGTVYSTTSNTYNALDQITRVRQYQGADSSSTYQDTTMTYDGFGRLKTRHLPEQQVDSNNSASTDHTTWDYNADDTVETLTDARGASRSYSYNYRHLVTQIDYDAHGSGVTEPVPASFEYDAVGNRTSMSDGTGSVSYSYNQLSRMTSETRTFTGLSGSYALNYAYNLAGELTTLTIPYTSQEIGYTYDGVGRSSSVSASGFSTTYYDGQWHTQSVTSFASNIQYRASGARKSMTYGNNTSDAITYNDRLQPATYSISNLNYGGNYTSMAWNYDYYADGRPYHAYDETEHKWDRSYAYDHAARLSEGDTNRRAQGLSPDSGNPDPYQQSLSYDAFNHTTSHTGSVYSYELSDSASYTNNRRSSWGYDADGNTTASASYAQTFDAGGQYTNAVAFRNAGDGGDYPYQPELEITQKYDGNGQSAKRIQLTRQNIYDLNTSEMQGVDERTRTSYYVSSTVLGGAQVMEVSLDWQESPYAASVWVYVGGERIATFDASYVMFEHHNPVTGSWVTTNGYSSSRQAGREERDPMGGETPITAPPQPSSYVSGNVGGAPLFIDGGDPFNYSSGHVIDGLPVSDSDWERRTGNGSVTVERTLRNGNREQGVNTRFLGGSVWVDSWTTTYSFAQTSFPEHVNPDGSIRVLPSEAPIVTINATNTGQFVTADGEPQGIAESERVTNAIDRAREKIAKNYDGCLKKLGNSPAPPKAQAADMLAVSDLEAIDVGTMAVTWAGESPRDDRFAFYFNSNPNKGEKDNADIGPMQVNYKTYHGKLEVLGVGDVFGTTTTGTEYFNGQPFANLRAGARILKDYGGKGRNAAGLYRTGTGKFRKTPNGQAEYDKRAGYYDLWIGGFNEFFGCLKK